MILADSVPFINPIIKPPLLLLQLFGIEPHNVVSSPSICILVTAHSHTDILTVTLLSQRTDTNGDIELWSPLFIKQLLPRLIMSPQPQIIICYYEKAITALDPFSEVFRGVLFSCFMRDA